MKQSQAKIQASIFLMVVGVLGCVVLNIGDTADAQTTFNINSDSGYGYNSTTGIMTDTNGLTYKTETNNVLTVNNERYLAFALKGTVGATEYTYTSMNFSWTWHMENNSGDYVFWAENDNPNFIWRQYYYFYQDPLQPMKIKHYLKNDLADITDMQMYYLLTVSNTDVIERNMTKYRVGDIKPFHIEKNLNSEVSIVNFNDIIDFNFNDLVDNGFTINEFYIGSGSVIDKPLIDIMAIGFTKNNGHFPKGAEVWIDPSIKRKDKSPIPKDKQNASVKHVNINGKKAIQIKFANLKKDFNIKEEAKKQNKKPFELLNIKKTNYYGDVELKLKHYVNVTTNQSYSCNCRNETIEYPANLTNGTEAYNATKWVCDTCYKDVTTEQFLEIDPETFILKKNEPIYEVMERPTKFEKMEGGWGYAIWTDVNIMGLQIEGATWWNATFGKKKEIQISNSVVEVINYSLLMNVSYDSDMSNAFEDLRFTNGSENEVLSYWIEDKVNSLYADVWVKYPHTLTNTTNTTVYMYYDNTSAVSSESDIKNAFVFGDDFEDTGFAEWTGTGCTTTTARSSTYAQQGDYSANVTQTQVEGYGGREHQFSGAEHLTYYIYDYDDIDNMAWQTWVSPDASLSDICLGMRKDNPNFYCYFDTSITDTTIARSVGWHKFELIQDGADIDAYVDGSEEHTFTSETMDRVVMGMYYHGGGGTNIGYYDTITVNRYLATTPLYSFGAEEISDTKPTYSLNEQNSTYAREDILHSIYLTSSGTLDSFIFSIDNGTGSFINDTVDTSPSGSNSWVNVTKRMSYTVGDTIRWQVHANSTVGDSSSSSIFSYDLTGHLQGTVTDADTSETVAGTTIWIINNTDNTTVTTLETDASGNWEYGIVAGTYHIVASKNSTYEGDVKNNIVVS